MLIKINVWKIDRKIHSQKDRQTYQFFAKLIASLSGYIQGGLSIIIWKIERQIDRQIDRQIHKRIDRQTYKFFAELIASLSGYIQGDLSIIIWKIDRKIDRQIDRQIDLPVLRRAYSLSLWLYSRGSSHYYLEDQSQRQISIAVSLPQVDSKQIYSQLDRYLDKKINRQKDRLIQR